MGIIILIAIIIIAMILFKDFKDYQKVKPRLRAFHNQVIEEGKQLRQNAKEEMKIIKCKEGGNCNFILKNKTYEYIDGWGDVITEHYECTKCKTSRSEIIQHCNQNRN